MSIVLLCLGIGLISFVLTMVGLGGGLIFSPLFILLGFPLSTALSASLFLNGTAAVSAAITFFRKKMVDVKIGLPLLITSCLFAPVGAMISNRINMRLFIILLTLVILIAAARMLFSKKAEEARIEIGNARRILGGGAIGVVIGFMAGLFGIGGGVFVLPLLIYMLKVPTKTAAATSIFIVVFSSFSGFVAHQSLADIDWKFVLLAALFSFIGGQAGSMVMAEKLKGPTVRRIFGVILILFALKLVQKGFF